VLQRGNLQISQELDLDQSPGTDVGGSPALVYNSERVNVKPIIQATVQSDNSQALPATLTATLTFNGTTQTGQTYSTSGLHPGDLIVVAQQVSTAVTTSGRYTYTLDVSFNYATPVTRELTGAAFVIAEDSSPYGAGWTLAGVDKLISISQQTAGTYTFASGWLREYGAGGYGFYADNGAGGYTSPAGDNGSLTKATGGGVTTYTYTTPDGVKQTFFSNGELYQTTSADGFASLVYDWGSLSPVHIYSPDGATATLTYSGSTISKIQTGSRTVTLTINGSGDLTTFTNADGDQRTFSYDGTHHLTDDHFDILRGTYAYTHGVVTGFTTGDMATDPSAGRSTDSPGILVGLDSLGTSPVWSSVTDPLGRTTREQLDQWGQPLVVVSPDRGATTTITRDSNGWITKETDPLGRVTTIVRDSAGYITQQTNPDGGITSYVYQTAFHALTQSTDERGNTTNMSYDASTGHLLTVTDPLNKVTTYTYNSSSGLLETVTDALGRVTTTLYDSSRRVQTTINAVGDRATLTYDGNGNAATQVDELGRTTTSVNDALGRVNQTTDPTGALFTVLYDTKAGLETSAQDALGHTTSFTYNSRGEQTKLTEAVGTADVRSYASSYDRAGQDIVDLNANGNAHTTTYDAAGRPQSQIDPFGTVTTSYDLAGEVTKQLDQLNRPTTYSYDPMGRGKTTTDALGDVSTTVYDLAGNVTEVDDARGYKTTYSYDALNRQVAMTGAAGTSDAATSTTVYDAVGNVYQTIDALGHTSQNGYDALNRVTTLTEALGTSDQRVTTYAYDKVGNQTSTTDARGIRTDTTFDKDNRATVVTEAAGTSIARTSTTVYDLQGNVTSSVDPLGRTVTYAYDNLNRQVGQTSASGTSDVEATSWKLDGQDNRYTDVDALGYASNTSYDELDRAIHFTDRLGHTTWRSYDAASSLHTTTDAQTVPNTTTYFTDLVGRQQTVQDAQHNLSTSVYDAGGNQTGSIDANNHWSTMVYDGLGRAIAQTDALNHTGTTVYDKAGNVIRTVDAASKTITYTYDNLNRQLTMQAPGLGVVTTVYDAGDHVVNTIDGLNHTTTMVYDELGRKTKDIDARGYTTTYLYDLLGNQTGLIDPDANRTTFVYDNQNRVVTQTDPLNHSVTMAYDKDNRLTSRTDRLGRRIDSQYDLNGQLTTQVWYSGGSAVNTLTFQYDPNGNQTVAQDSHGAYTTSYDTLNRVSQVQGLFGLTLTNSYDAAGNRTLLQDSKGGVTTSVYDNNNQLTSRQFGGVSQTPLRFDLAYNSRNLVGTLTRYSDLAGTTKVGESDYSYDDGQRLSNLQHKNGSGTLLANYTYTYDLEGRVTAETLNGGAATSYSYDTTNQLTNDGTKAYSFDGAGNRTMSGYTTGADNQLTKDGVYSYSYSYDAEGNLTKKSKGASAETWTFSYDNRNQLTGVTERSQDGGGTLLLQATYTYDVFNRRIQEDKWLSGSGSSTTRLGYDSDGTVWADLDGSNNLVTRYLRRDGEVAPVARIASGGVTWPLVDWQGSVRNTTTGSGVVNGTVVYDGFGGIITTTSLSALGRYDYTGLFDDHDLGLLFAAKRVYNPTTGRWISEDPMGFAAGDYHLDRYVGNDPTNAMDPSGLQAQAPPFAYFIDGTDQDEDWPGGTVIHSLWNRTWKAGEPAYYLAGHAFSSLENPNLNCSIAYKSIKGEIDAALRAGQKAPPLDLFGCSAGAVQILAIARQLEKDYGKKVTIRFMALIDPVATGITAMLTAQAAPAPVLGGPFLSLGNIPDTVPGNVQHLLLVRSKERERPHPAMAAFALASLYYFLFTPDGKDQSIFSPHLIYLNNIPGAPGHSNFEQSDLNHQDINVSHEVEKIVVSRAKAAGVKMN
jgi:RHS repeat-associated protein